MTETAMDRHKRARQRLMERMARHKAARLRLQEREARTEYWWIPFEDMDSHVVAYRLDEMDKLNKKVLEYLNYVRGPAEGWAP